MTSMSLVLYEETRSFRKLLAMPLSKSGSPLAPCCRKLRVSRPTLPGVVRRGRLVKAAHLSSSFQYSTAGYAIINNVVNK